MMPQANVLDNKECWIILCVVKFVVDNELKILLHHVGKIIQFLTKSFLWQRCNGLSSIHKNFLGEGCLDSYPPFSDRRGKVYRIPHPFCFL